MVHFTTLSRRVTVGIGLGALVIALALPSSTLGAQPAITFGINMFANCFDGHGAANATVNITWRSADNTLKKLGSTTSGTTGSWEFCAAAASTWVAPNDRIKVSDGTNSRSYIVPNIDMAIDRVSGLVTGTGPAGRTLRLCPSWRFADYQRCHSVRIAQDGTWQYGEAGGIDGARVDISWASPNGDHVYISAHAQNFAVTLGKSTFSGMTGQPRSHAHLELNGGAKATGDVDSDQYGSFTGQFVDSHGHPVTVAASDHVSASIASDADWIMPQIVATPNRVNDTATGNCSTVGRPYYDVEVTVTHSGHYRGSAFADLDPDGNFTADFRDPGGFFSPTNIIRGDRLLVACGLATDDLAQLKVIAK